MWGLFDQFPFLEGLGCFQISTITHNSVITIFRFTYVFLQDNFLNVCKIKKLWINTAKMQYFFLKDCNIALTRNTFKISVSQ